MIVLGYVCVAMSGLMALLFLIGIVALLFEKPIDWYGIGLFSKAFLIYAAIAICVLMCVLEKLE